MAKGYGKLGATQHESTMMVNISFTLGCGWHSLSFRPQGPTCHQMDHCCQRMSSPEALHMSKPLQRRWRWNTGHHQITRSLSKVTTKFRQWWWAPGFFHGTPELKHSIQFMVQFFDALLSGGEKSEMVSSTQAQGRHGSIEKY